MMNNVIGQLFDSWMNRGTSQHANSSSLIINVLNIFSNIMHAVSSRAQTLNIIK